jgi:hypothetical protein
MRIVREVCARGRRSQDTFDRMHPSAQLRIIYVYIGFRAGNMKVKCLE